ncbi:MAG: ATP-dependent DNA helicase [Leptospiraceae bacterium]|nr:ATP-dependent DNA helicase RecQ [Leptospiraceae bacterium]MCK6382410.1 ATP-dependent DNA helicase [Leptospiraceae bacterium]NUM41115.1 ATP-dependent DNA helicase RecQ [Leptospiraceae bacterium]
MEKFSLDSLQVSLEKIFGLKEFREGQLEAIRCILSGKDTLVLFPTGGGKSITYQLPAAISEDKTCIVISPLISLMKDQVDALSAIGIPSTFINSSQDELEQMRSISRFVTGKLKLVYVSPEKATSEYFLKIVSQISVSFIAIDEAHCISQWGHDFRKEYRDLLKLRKVCGEKIPVIAVTATATERVISDICESLKMQDPKIVKRSFYRKNLSFKVEFTESERDKEIHLEEILIKHNFNNKNSGKAIIYCATRVQVDGVYEKLKNSGFRVGKYHAGRSATARENMQNSYFTGKVNILIATNAFGMGVDYPDIRLVVHYQTPSSLEHYFQESGRAGRDGKNSECVLFFQNKDVSTQRFILQKGSHNSRNLELLTKMKEYSFTSICRQKFLCNYFGEALDKCDSCDNCKNKKSNYKRDLLIEKEEFIRNEKLKKSSHEFTNEEIEIILNLFEFYPGFYGKNILCQILRGKKTKDILKRKLEKSELYGKLKNIPDESILLLFEKMLEKNELKVAGKKYPKLYHIKFPPIDKSSLIKKTSVPKKSATLLKELKNYRDREARRLKWKKYMVFQNAVLKRISEQKPENKVELLNIKGVGNSKAEKFGEGILSILEKF